MTKNDPLIQPVARCSVNSTERKRYRHQEEICLVSLFLYSLSLVFSCCASLSTYHFLRRSFHRGRRKGLLNAVQSIIF